MSHERQQVWIKYMRGWQIYTLRKLLCRYKNIGYKIMSNSHSHWLETAGDDKDDKELKRSENTYPEHTHCYILSLVRKCRDSFNTGSHEGISLNYTMKMWTSYGKKQAFLDYIYSLKNCHYNCNKNIHYTAKCYFLLKFSSVGL